MLNYFKKVWKLTGTLSKFQYIRLTTIVWLFIIGVSIITMLFSNYSGFSIGQMILNILEGILFAVILVFLAYVDTRFFPWAKVDLNPHKGMSIMEDINYTQKREYQYDIHEGPQMKSTIKAYSNTQMVDKPQDVPTNVPYSVRQNIKAKYGNNYDVYRNNGNSDANPAYVSDQDKQSVQQYGQQYNVYAKRPNIKTPVTTYTYEKQYVQESYGEFMSRIKEKQFTTAIMVLFYRLIVLPFGNFIFNFLLWPIAFIIGSYKMRGEVKKISDQAKNN